MYDPINWLNKQAILGHLTVQEFFKSDENSLDSLHFYNIGMYLVRLE